MAEAKNIREKLLEYKYSFDLLQKIPCSSEENKQYEKLLEDGKALPEGVFAYEYSTSAFYTVYEADLSQEEINEYLTYKKLGFLRTIKNCALFFTILTIIGMVLGFLAAL